MTAVKQCRLGAGRLGNAVRHQMVGKFDIIDCRQLLLLRRLDQEGDGSGRRLRLGAAAGKGGVVRDVILRRKVAHNTHINSSTKFKYIINHRFLRQFRHRWIISVTTKRIIIMIAII